MKTAEITTSATRLTIASPAGYFQTLVVSALQAAAWIALLTLGSVFIENDRSALTQIIIIFSLPVILLIVAVDSVRGSPQVDTVLDRSTGKATIQSSWPGFKVSRTRTVELQDVRDIDFDVFGRAGVQVVFGSRIVLTGMLNGESAHEARREILSFLGLAIE